MSWATLVALGENTKATLNPDFDREVVRLGVESPWPAVQGSPLPMERGCKYLVES